MAATIEQRGTYCKLGELELYVFDGLQEFTEKAGYAVAEHEMLSGTNVVQSMGEILKEVTMELQLRDYWDFVDVGYILESLTQMQQQGEAERLFFGDGSYAGQYIITEMQTRILKTYVNGAISQADLSLTLKEWVEHETLELGKVEKKPPKRKTFLTKKQTEKKSPKGSTRFIGPLEEGDPRQIQTVVVRPDGIFRVL